MSGETSTPMPVVVFQITCELCGVTVDADAVYEERILLGFDPRTSCGCRREPCYPSK